jgi:hypothetical protein
MLNNLDGCRSGMIQLLRSQDKLNNILLILTLVQLKELSVADLGLDHVLNQTDYRFLSHREQIRQVEILRCFHIIVHQELSIVFTLGLCQYFAAFRIYIMSIAPLVIHLFLRQRGFRSLLAVEKLYFAFA